MQDLPNTGPLRVNRISSAYWRVLFDAPPLNLMGPSRLSLSSGSMSLATQRIAWGSTWGNSAVEVSRQCHEPLTGASAGRRA